MGRSTVARSLLLAVVLSGALSSGHAVRADEDDGGPVIDRLDRKIVLLDPFPAASPYPGKVTLSGRLLSGFKNPQIAVVAPSGHAEYVAPKDLRVVGDRFSATLALDGGRGVYRIEVTAAAPQGATRTAVRLRLYAGVAVVRQDDPVPPDEGDDATKEATVILERQAVTQIAALRRAAGVDPLPILEPLAAAARAHAAACAVRNVADARVDAAGDLAQRCTALYRWPSLVGVIPAGAPSPGPMATSYVVSLVDTAKSLEPLLARWKRAAAMLVPLLDARWTHVGAGIVSARGNVWVVVGLAQVNGDDVAKDVEARWATLLSDYKSAAKPADKAAPLREMALWDRKEAAREAREQSFSQDFDLRAAAWDAKAVLDEAPTRKDAVDLVRRAETDAAQGRPASALAAAAWMSKCLWARFLSEPASALKTRLEAEATQALAAADALAKDGKSDEAKAAYESLAAKYPGTPAAAAARSRGH